MNNVYAWIDSDVVLLLVAAALAVAVFAVVVDYLLTPRRSFEPGERLDRLHSAIYGRPRRRKR